MFHLNLLAGWIGIVGGVLAGAGIGLFFGNEDWLGGYGSWTRRMLRLGHISFFCMGVLYILFDLTTRNINPANLWPSYLMVAGLAGMPAVCYAAAFYKKAKGLFPLPVFCVLAASLYVVFKLAGV